MSKIINITINIITLSDRGYLRKLAFRGVGVGFNSPPPLRTQKNSELRTQKFIQHNTCVYVCNNVTVFKHFRCIKYIKIPVFVSSISD